MWDVFWIIIRMLLIVAFLGIGFALATRLWRQGQAKAALCPACGAAVPLSRTKPHQHCRSCGRHLVENHRPLPGVELGQVSAAGRR